MEVDNLFDAIVRGRFDIIQKYLYEGGDANLRNFDGNALLHIAIMKEEVSIAKFLIERGADITLKNNNNETAYNLVLAYPPDCDAKLIMLKILIGAGADPDTMSENYGVSALHIAIANMDIELVRLIIDLGGDVDIPDGIVCFWSPLHWAAASVTSDDPTIFKLLLSAGADPHSIAVLGDTPLHILAKYVPYEEVSLGQIVKVFLDHGVDLNRENDRCWTPMDCAIMNSNVEAVKAFVLVAGMDVNSEHVSDIYAEDSNGQTILHGACSEMHLPTIEFLLEHGANLNSLDLDKVSPLQRLVDSIVNSYRENYAFGVEGMEALSYLLRLNPDINTITIDGENILSPKQVALPECLWRNLVAYIAKLYDTDRPIHSSLLKTISKNSKFKEFFLMCLA